jgi:ribonucleotide reductase beta subunit family protein with ferritin-like domain
MEEFLLKKSQILKDLNAIEDQISNLKNGNSLARHTLFPIKDKDAFRFFEMQEDSRWNIGEIKIHNDKLDFDKSSKEIQKFVKLNMGITLALDNIIAENLKTNFIAEADSMEEKFYFNSQENMEYIHAATYNLIIYTFLGEAETIKFIEEIANIKEMQNVVNYVKKWSDPSIPKHLRFAAFAFIEGVLFCSFFTGIFYLKSSGKFNNLILANEMIQKDETIHRDFNVYKFKRLVAELSLNKVSEMKDIIYNICNECVLIQDSLIDITYSEINDLTPESVKQYTRSIADLLLHDLGHKPLYNVNNPFTWLSISNQVKTNFYDLEVSQYKRGFTDAINKCLNIQNNKTIEELFNGDDDF